MTTATTPAALVREAENNLTSARVAEAFLTQHPDLPVEFLHAGRYEEDETPAEPLLVVQLGRDQFPALEAFAARIGGVVDDSDEVTHRVATVVDGVRVEVTAWTLDDF